jgi:hypothetical protein
MNNILKLLWLTYFLIASLLSFADSPEHIVVRGKVTCQKKAVENVAVSDGKSIIANVYNYDQEWNIYVFENNNFVSTMERYWGEDRQTIFLKLP